MRIILAISIFLSLMLHSLAHAADQRIAVLELRGAADGQVLRLMTDEVRGGVLQAVGDGEFIVMTRENMAVIAKDMGKDLSCLEGECEVETGRNIGAAYVVSGEVISVAGTLNMVLKLHDTEQGALRSKRRISASNVQGLIDDAQSAAAALTREGLKLKSASAPPAVALDPSVTGEVQVTTGSGTDYAALAARAAQATAAREQREAELAEQDRLAAAAREAERKRMAEQERQAQAALEEERARRVDAAKQELLAKAKSDYDAMRPIIAMDVTPETRPVLAQFVKDYDKADVRIDGKAYPVTVPGVAEVSAKLNKSGSARARPARRPARPPAPAGYKRPARLVGGGLTAAGVLCVGLGTSMESKLAGQVVDGSVNQTQWEDQRKTVNVMYGLGQVMVVGGVSSLVASIWLDGRLSPAVPVRPRVQILADPIGKTAGLEVYNAW